MIGFRRGSLVSGRLSGCCKSARLDSTATVAIMRGYGEEKLGVRRSVDALEVVGRY